MTAAAPVLDSAAYRRQARRLRHVFRHKPVDQYLSLKQLSERRDATYQQHSRPQGWRAVTRNASGQFADDVARQIEGKVLPYSKRLELLSAAEESGIGRFQANLIIAAVQHQTGRSEDVASASDAPATRLPLAPLLVFISVQAVIMLSLWALFM